MQMPTAMPFNGSQSYGIVAGQAVAAGGVEGGPEPPLAGGALELAIAASGTGPVACVISIGINHHQGWTYTFDDGSCMGD